MSAHESKLTVRMEWNECQQMWLMKLHFNNQLLYDFHDCGTVRAAFRGLDKEKPQVYKIVIARGE